MKRIFDAHTIKGENFFGWYFNFQDYAVYFHTHTHTQKKKRVQHGKFTIVRGKTTVCQHSHSGNSQAGYLSSLKLLNQAL